MGKRDPKLEAKWRETMSSWEQSDQTVKAFCRDRGLTEGAFHSWRRELRRRDGIEPSARPRRAARRSKSESRFVVLSATTSCTSVREFSPLEMYLGETKLAPLGGPGARRCFQSAHRFGRGQGANLGFAMASESATPDLLASVGD